LKWCESRGKPRTPTGAWFHSPSGCFLEYQSRFSNASKDT
jgi:hypothetical protein